MQRENAKPWLRWMWRFPLPIRRVLLTLFLVLAQPLWLAYCLYDGGLKEWWAGDVEAITIIWRKP